MTAVADYPPVLTPTEFRTRFETLAAEWKDQSKLLSSTHRMVLLRPYQRIIGMGPAVVPLILEDLRREPDHWFWALEAITGDNPYTPDTNAGFTLIDVGKATNAWLEWGKRHGLI